MVSVKINKARTPGYGRVFNAKKDASVEPSDMRVFPTDTERGGGAVRVSVDLGDELTVFEKASYTGRKRVVRS